MRLRSLLCDSSGVSAATSFAPPTITTPQRPHSPSARHALAILAGEGEVAPETPEESRAKERNRIDPRLRLACRIRVCADVSVTAPYW